MRALNPQSMLAAKRKNTITANTQIVDGGSSNPNAKAAEKIEAITAPRLAIPVSLESSV